MTVVYYDYVKPRYSRKQVDRSGSVIRDNEISLVEKSDLEVVHNWRSSMEVPLLKAYNLLLDADLQSVVITKRLKRIESIKAKLCRDDELKLSKMQDIAGCRVICSSINDVYDYRDLRR